MTLKYDARTNQQRVTDWVRGTFTEKEAKDVPERALRAAEEVLELAQACNVDAATLKRLVDYVFSRPTGEPAKEIAGSMVTIYAAASALGVDADLEFETELARIQQPEVVERCRRRQHEKRAALAGLDADFVRTLSETRPITGTLSPAASAMLEDAIEGVCQYANDEPRETLEAPADRGVRMLAAFNRERDAGFNTSDALDKIAEEFPEVSGGNVHILFHGLPLCGFSRKIPALWPEGHRWVRIEEWKNANCQKCLNSTICSTYRTR